MTTPFDAQQVRDWMLPAFDWLGQQWEASPEKTWEDLKPGFLQQLGLSQESDYPVARRLSEWVVTLSNEDCRAALTTPDQRDQALAFLVQQENQARIASLVWITPEQQEQLNILWESFGDWRQWLPAQLDDAWPEWRTSTDEVLVPWLNPYIVSWVSSVTPTPTPVPVVEQQPVVQQQPVVEQQPVEQQPVAQQQPAADQQPVADSPTTQSPPAEEQAAPQAAVVEAIVEADLADPEAPDMTEEQIQAAINQILKERGEAVATSA